MIKNLILLVEDDESILYNLSLFLTLNNFEVITALNGRDALEKLKKMIILPNLILSDIKMPEINGYELLKKISQNPTWHMIPFIFLSAKAYREEIEKGILLGADDYLTKPIDQKLYTILINKKIDRIHIENELRNKFESELLERIKSVFDPTKKVIDKSSIFLLIMESNKDFGSVIVKKYLGTSMKQINLESIGVQLFQSTVSLFDQKRIISPEVLILNVKNSNMKVMVLYDLVSEFKTKRNQKQIMITLIAPEISYLDSLKIKTTLLEISSKIKHDDLDDFTDYYEKIQTNLVKTQEQRKMRI